MNKSALNADFLLFKISKLETLYVVGQHLGVFQVKKSAQLSATTGLQAFSRSGLFIVSNAHVISSLWLM